MKLSNLRAFEKHLQGATPNHFAPLYIFEGKDAFQRKEAFSKLKHALQTNSSKQPLEIQTFEADRLTTKELMQELHELSLFASQRILLIENSEKLSKECMTALEGYFENPNPSIYFVLSLASLHHGSTFYKKGEKSGIVLEFAEEKSWEKESALQEWITKQIQEQGKNIETAACKQLTKHLGTDRQLIHTEIQKLICYAGTRQQITVKDVQAVVTYVDNESIWQLGEALFQRNAAEALRICKSLLQDETPFIVLLRQLRSQFQTELQICTLLAQGGGAAEVSQQFPYMKGSILERHLMFAEGYGLNNCKKALLKIDDTELQAKNGGLDTDLLADLLIVELASKS